MSDSAAAQVCSKCGLKMGQVGSFTYWIFNDDRCRCNAVPANEGKGEVFDRRYELLELVGGGAMGYVYKALDSQTQQIVALKLLRHELSGNQLAVKRLMKEVAIMSGLHNSNLGSVIGYGQEQDGVPYLVMEFVEGQNLADVLKRHGKLKLDYALDVFIQLCSGLICAHGNGIAHRDLKPGNIIVQPSRDAQSRDRIVIVDFGFAKLLSDATSDSKKLTQEGEAFGTPAYMSPEQCRGERLDERSDIYSLGCIMYEALTGTPPLLGPNVLATVAKQVNEAPLSMQSLDGGIPEEIDAMILKCLEKDPIHRYQSASDLRQELDQFARVGTIAGRRTKKTKPAAAPGARDKETKGLRNTEAAYLRMMGWPLVAVIAVSILIGCVAAFNIMMLANKNAPSAVQRQTQLPATAEHIPMTIEPASTVVETEPAKLEVEQPASMQPAVESAPAEPAPQAAAEPKSQTSAQPHTQSQHRKVTPRAAASTPKHANTSSWDTLKNLRQYK